MVDTMPYEEYGMPDDGGKRVRVYPTREARVIAEDLLPEWWELFVQKNRKYRAIDDLGPRGVYPDINRKVAVIRERIWEGNADSGSNEPTEEVIQDLIGHLFLMWAKLRDE